MCPTNVQGTSRQPDLGFKCERPPGQASGPACAEPTHVACDQHSPLMPCKVRLGSALAWQAMRVVTFPHRCPFVDMHNLHEVCGYGFSGCTYARQSPKCVFIVHSSSANSELMWRRNKKKVQLGCAVHSAPTASHHHWRQSSEKKCKGRKFGAHHYFKTFVVLMCT